MISFAMQYLVVFVYCLLKNQAKGMSTETG